MSRVFNLLAAVVAGFQKMPMFWDISKTPHGHARGGREFSDIPAPNPRKVRRMGQRYRSSRKFSCVRTILSITPDRVVCRTLGGSLENWPRSRFFAANSVMM